VKELISSSSIQHEKKRFGNFLIVFMEMRAVTGFRYDVGLANMLDAS